jgi:hypothetical protein
MPRPRHGTVVAYLALFVALSGSAYAAAKIGSKQINDNSILSKDIKNKTIALGDISTKARKSLAGATGAPGAPGTPGAPGAPGESAVPARAVTVGAGGSPVENGNALRAALAGLPAASAAEPRAVVLGPGRYDLNGTGITVPSDVTLAGAGTSATVIDSSPANVQLKLLTLGARTLVRDLTVTTASKALGSTGIDETGGDGATLERVAVSAGVGVVKRGGIIRNSTVEGLSVGVSALPSPTRVLLLDSSRVQTTNGGATTAFSAGTTFNIMNSQIFAGSAQGTATGVRYDGPNGTSTIRSTWIDVGGGAESRGVFVDTINGNSEVEIDASQIEVIGTPSIALKANFSDIDAGVTKLSATQLFNQSNGAQVTCVGTYSAVYAPLAC